MRFRIHVKQGDSDWWEEHEAKEVTNEVQAEIWAKSQVNIGNYNALRAGFAAPAEDPPKEPLKIGKLVFEGGDGSTKEKAIIIKNAANEVEGVNAEAKWIAKVHPGWRKGNQALRQDEDTGKYYDLIEYQTPDGKTASIYFDITDLFGQW